MALAIFECVDLGTLDRYLLSSELRVLGEKIWKVDSGARCSFRDVRIGCRGFEACMPQNLLNRADWHARVQTMACVTVAQAMRCTGNIDSRDPQG